MTNKNIQQVYDFFEKQLDRTNSWLNFAEAKNAALIAINVAIIAVLVNIIGKTKTLISITIAITVVSNLICLFSFLPNLTNVSKNKIKTSNSDFNLIYFNDVSKIICVKTYVEKVGNKYFSDVPIDELISNNYIIDLASEIITNSQITVKKYEYFKAALITDVIAFILIAIIFIVA